MDRSARILLGIAVAVMLLAWCRVGWTTTTTASPAHEIEFVTRSGDSVSQWDVHCHGPMLIHESAAWQMCARTLGDREEDTLGHFDLRNRVATLLDRPTEETNLRAITSAIPHPDGGLLIIADSELLHVTSSAIRNVAEWSAYQPDCLRIDERTLEVASFFERVRPVVARFDLDASTWVRNEGAVPSGSDARLSPAGCRWTEHGWVFAWTRAPTKVEGTGSISIDVLEGSQGGRLETVASFTFHPEQSERVAVTPDGHVMLEQPLLDPMQSFGLPRSWGAQPPIELRDGRWREPGLPEGARTVLLGHDHVVTDTRIDSVINLESPPFLRVNDRWLRIDTDPDRDVVLVPVDGGPPTAPITGKFWVSVGLKLFPDPEGGYWMMGGLGEAVVHLDANFERDDTLGLFGRLSRALQNDRAKYNSDFYDGLAWFHRFGLLWTLFGGLIVLAPAARKRSDPLRIAAAVYLVGVVIGGYSFWKLSGVFW